MKARYAEDAVDLSRGEPSYESRRDLRAGGTPPLRVRLPAPAQSEGRERGETVLKVRVLVANQPRLMRELVLDTIAGHEDIEVVGEVGEETSILEKVSEARPDFVIVTLHSWQERPWICDVLWERFPRVRVLALQPESNDSVLYWATLSVQATRVETSENGILETLRARSITHQSRGSELSPKVN